MGSIGMSSASLAFSLVFLVCWVIILIDAFKNEWWKGLLCFFCFLYMLYYAFAEFQNDKKALIIALWLGSMVLSWGLFAMAMQHGVATNAFAPATP